MCDSNANEKYVEDCIHVLKYDDCLFHSGIVMPQDHIASLYSLRLDIAKESGNCSETYLNDFGKCVQKLNESKSNLIGLTWINGSDNSFLMFYEPATKIILGILKSENPVGLKASEEYATDTVNRGNSSEAEKYSKGKFIRSWK